MSYDETRFQLQQALEQIRNAARAVDAASIHVKSAVEKIDKQKDDGKSDNGDNQET
ncbi:MAG: hypothetical protein ACOC8P_03070 [Dichotomicrobium sp.]